MCNGSICAGASQERVELWYEFGEKLGLAFQIQDDYLDTFGKQDSLGKKVGGDILADKKTFLFIHASSTHGLPSTSGLSDDEKIEKITNAMRSRVQIFEKTHESYSESASKASH